MNDIREEALRRQLSHAGKPTSTPFLPEVGLGDLKGLRGEEEFAREFGLSVEFPPWRHQRWGVFIFSRRY